MGYVILQLAVTIDGLIARADGTVDFLEEISPEFSDTFKAFVEEIDTIIMGRKTYDQMITFGEMPFPDKRIIVLTNQGNLDNVDHVEFYNGDISNLVRNIDNNIWLFGGSNVIKQFLDAELIDEMQLFIVPFILGDGIPLFSKNNGMSNLKLIHSRQYGDNMFLIYKK